MSEYERGDNGYDERGRGRADVRDYDNDYSRGSSKEKDPAKPLSASDITAIAETTVNQLMRREEKRSQDNRERIREREDRTDRKSRERSQPAEKANPMSRLEKLKDPRIVTLKGLKAFHKEADIRRKLTDERMKFRDIRVIFNKASQSGTAFVEFMSDSEAARWVRHNRGMLKMSGEYLTMDLSKPLAAPKKDWVCLPCGEKNHHARETCYSCQSEKQEAKEKPRLRSKSPPDEFGREKSSASAPSNVLMFRGLDYRTTEDQVMRRLNDICDVAIRDVRLITDKYTNKSRGFCFVEVTSTEDGRSLYTKITKMDPPFEIGSRKVNVSYQREPTAAKETNQAAQSAIAAAQWSAGAMKTGAPTTTTPTTPAVVEKPAVVKEDPADAKMPLQVGSYVYDEKSGFYYDSASGLYYDPKTKYYYNPTDQQYYFWDAVANKYQSLTDQATPSEETPASVPSAKAAVEEAGKASTPKASKAMNAKKIQKDMERWAKAKNRQQAKAAPNRLEEEEEETSNVPVGNNIALKIAQGYAGAVSQPAPQAPPQTSVFPITAISTAPAALTDDQISRKYEDLTAMACLLCKRKFPSLDNLRRHQELSDLHQKGLAEEKEKNAGAPGPPAGSGYKDRAQERREKFGSEAPPPKKMGYHAQGGR